MIGTVEGGHMTKDLALLIGSEQRWETSEEYLGTIADHLQKALRLTRAEGQPAGGAMRRGSVC